jgi:hypothetical protein
MTDRNQAEDTYALVKSLGGFMCPPDRLEDHLVKGTVAATGRKSALDVPVASQGVNSGPLDLLGVTLDAEGWSSEIPVPDNTRRWHDYLRKTYPLCGGLEIKTRVTGGDLVAIRLKARSASDTEGLPVGAVVRVWYDGMPSPEVTRYAMFGGGTLPWSRLMSTAEQAAGDRERITMSAFPGAVYLPIDVRGGA